MNFGDPRILDTVWPACDLVYPVKTEIKLKASQFLHDFVLSLVGVDGKDYSIESRNQSFREMNKVKSCLKYHLLFLLLDF